MEIPKHTTQVGTVSAHKKMYLEDYCISYLRQLDKDYPQEKKQIALYGCLQKEKTVEYAMVFGAALLGLGKARTDSLTMIQKEEAEKIRQTSFPDYKLVGLIVGIDTVSQNLYWLGYGSKAIAQDGYFIFYDRNEAMLAFMMQREQEEREPDVDPVIAKKADMDLKKQEAAEEAAREKERSREKENTREKAETEPGGKYRRQMQKQSKPAKNRKGAEPARGMMPMERRSRSRFPAVAAALLVVIGVVYGVRTYLPQDFQVPDVGAYITELISQNSILGSEEEGTQEVNAQTSEDDSATQEEEDTESQELVTQEAPLTITDMDVVEIPDLETMAETSGEDAEENPEAPTQGQSDAGQVSAGEAADAENAGNGSVTESTDTGAASTAETQTSAASDVPETYLIQRGDNLLTILRNHYGDDSMLQEVCEVNQIEDADNIQVGQTIVLP